MSSLLLNQWKISKIYAERLIFHISVCPPSLPYLNDYAATALIGTGLTHLIVYRLFSARIDSHNSLISTSRSTRLLSNSRLQFLPSHHSTCNFRSLVPADRHGNTAKDGYALRGISDEELEARAKEEAESVMRMEVDGEEDEEGEEAWVDEGEDKKGKGKAKGGKKKKRTMATPQRRPVPSLPTSKTRKRPRPRGSSPSPTARKKTKTRTVTNKRERGVELEVESGGKKRRVGPSRKAARRGASIEIYDDSSDLTELEESEEEEEDITRSRGGKGKNSSKVGQNSKGVGMKDSTGGNEDSGTGRRRSPRGKAGVKK